MSKLLLPLRPLSPLLDRKLTVEPEPYSQPLPKGISSDQVARVLKEETNFVNIIARNQELILMRARFVQTVRNIQKEQV